MASSATALLAFSLFSLTLIVSGAHVVQSISLNLTETCDIIYNARIAVLDSWDGTPEDSSNYTVVNLGDFRTACNETNCTVDNELEMLENLTGAGCNGDCSVNSLGNASLDNTTSDYPVVLTHLGPVQGLTLDKAQVFYGLPFAEPPIGEKRWTPPSPMSAWSQPYDATFPRPSCMQMCNGELVDECPAKVSEDCLYLNVFVPLRVNLPLSRATALPVMMWIHGGDFVAGSATKPLFDGRFISNYTNTVVVTLEYRLGAFGFLVTGDDPESSAVGNYGLLDQQAAMRWVQENIAAFGGDPNKVTLFGESAGAQSVGLHLLMPSSEPLFKRAAVQSLPVSLPLKTRSEAEKLGSDFAKLTNCSVSDLACLRALSSQDVLVAQAGLKITNSFQFLEDFQTWAPFIDGELIQEQPLATFKQGHWSRKSTILGTTSEEGLVFVYEAFNQSLSTLDLVIYTTNVFKQNAIKILHKYTPYYQNQDKRAMLSQIITDYMFLCPTRLAARYGASVGVALWLYVFDHAPSDPNIWAGLPFCIGHVCHGAEIPFVFDSAPSTNFTLTPQETLLANRMACYWGALAHAGDPNSSQGQTCFCKQQERSVWPQYTAAEGWPIMNLTLQAHPQSWDRDHFCDFWDQLDIY